MREVRELWREEIVVRRLKWSRRGLGKKKLWNRTQKKRRFPRRETPLLYIFEFQVQGLEVNSSSSNSCPNRFGNVVKHGQQLDVICDKDCREFEEIVELDKEEFVQVMLRLHQANSSRKW